MNAEVIHNKAMEAVGEMKFEKLRLLSYMPRTKEAWASQFFCCSPKFTEPADPPVLSPGDVDSLLIPREGLVPRINIRHIKVLLMLGDVHFLDEHIKSHIIECESGIFFGHLAT